MIDGHALYVLSWPNEVYSIDFEPDVLANGPRIKS